PLGEGRDLGGRGPASGGPDHVHRFVWARRRLLSPVGAAGGPRALRGAGQEVRGGGGVFSRGGAGEGRRGARARSGGGGDRRAGGLGEAAAGRAGEEREL